MGRSLLDHLLSLPLTRTLFITSLALTPSSDHKTPPVSVSNKINDSCDINAADATAITSTICITTTTTSTTMTTTATAATPLNQLSLLTLNNYSALASATLPTFLYLSSASPQPLPPPAFQHTFERHPLYFTARFLDPICRKDATSPVSDN